MVTRTLKQVKVFNIRAYSQTLSGHGYYDEIPGITWNLGQVWESDEECARLLEAAIADWENRRTKKSLGELPVTNPSLWFTGGHSKPLRTKTS